MGFRWVPPLAGCVVLCAACADEVELVPASEPVERTPVIAVEAVDGGQEVAFGLVAPGEQASSALIVSNLGDAPLLVTELDLPARVGAVADLPRGIAPGMQARLDLFWAPAGDALLDGRIVVRSNDPERPALPLSTTGDAPAPAIALEPASVDLGRVAPGCLGTAEFSVVNRGRAPLTVDSVTLTANLDGFEPELPDPGWSLDPGEERVLRVRFLPGSLTPGAATLEVRSDDRARPVALARTFAAGAEAQARSDSWIQTETPHPDVLMVLDDSCSMGDNINSVMANIEEFTSVLDGLGVTFQVGVVTTDVGDGGILLGDVPVVTGDLVDAGQQFYDNLADLSIGNGSGVEQGFHSAWLATGPDLVAPHGPNAGFLRPDASLHIVFISDEPEQSGPIAGWSREDYLAEFQARTQGGQPVVVSTVTGGAEGCPGADPADDYVWMSESTGGATLSICTDAWGEAMQDIALASTSVSDSFELPGIPLPGSVTVYTDGVPLFVGWSFDPALNAVLFSPDRVPAPGTLIEVEYAVQSSCVE